MRKYGLTWKRQTYWFPPHIPMPDGSPFFGSPTKLFEYMSMGKAIVASNLGQLAKVLSQNETAILVEPGDVDQFVEAVRLLASDARLRESLGRRAREVAIERHTWTRNALNVMATIGDQTSARAKRSIKGEPYRGLPSGVDASELLVRESLRYRTCSLL